MDSCYYEVPLYYHPNGNRYETYEEAVNACFTQNGEQIYDEDEIQYNYSLSWYQVEMLFAHIQENNLIYKPITREGFLSIFNEMSCHCRDYHFLLIYDLIEKLNDDAIEDMSKYLLNNCRRSLEAHSGKYYWFPVFQSKISDEKKYFKNLGEKGVYTDDIDCTIPDYKRIICFLKILNGANLGIYKDYIDDKLVPSEINYNGFLFHNKLYGEQVIYSFEYDLDTEQIGKYKKESTDSCCSCGETKDLIWDNQMEEFYCQNCYSFASEYPEQEIDK